MAAEVQIEPKFKNEKWSRVIKIGETGPSQVFLTILLVHRAHRDEQKCIAKYGAHYEKYMAMVPREFEP